MKRLPWSLSLLLTTVHVGCGPAGQPFYGDYSASGTATLVLNSYGTNTAPVSGSYRISEGVDSDVVIIEPGGTCVVPATVQGDVATLRSGTTCVLSGTNGLTVTRTITSGIASLSGNTLQLNVSSTLMASGGGQSFPGSFTQNIMLTRVGR